MNSRSHELALHAILWLAIGVSPAFARPPGARVVDFTQDVQPVLAARCVKCHGQGRAEAGLRLLSRPEATKTLESGETAISPGLPERSQLLTRVASRDADQRMPPEGVPLTAAEIETLRNWIAEGADWPEHWAYRPLIRPSAPVLEDERWSTWPRSPVDQFILEQQLRRGLSPSQPADTRHLLRRVYYDLIGLPPSFEEHEAFRADPSPSAYERIVDRLLSSPRYGERWARHWMDLAHFAESHGHDQDRPRPHAWPYRDYLIRSFNEDKPYTRFVQEQIAGDVLFPRDPQAIVATGFLASGPWDESSLRDIREDSLDRQIGRYLDRDDIVTTVMSTFLSCSVHCARCHDHKFDPITQREYYGLQAVFAATDKANQPYDPDPQVAARRDELQQLLRELPARVERRDPTLLSAEIQTRVAGWEASAAEDATAWRPLELVEFHSGNGVQFERLSDHSLLAKGACPDKDVYTVVVRLQQVRCTALRLEVMSDASLPMSGPGRQDNGNLHLSEFRAWLIEKEPRSTPRPLSWKKVSSDFDQAGWGIQRAVDGDPGTAWGIYPRVGESHQAVFELTERLVSRAEDPLTIRVELQQQHGGRHLIGRFRLSATDRDGPLPPRADATPTRISSILQKPRKARSEAEQIELSAYCLRQTYESELSALPPRAMVYCGTNRFQADGSFRPAAQPRPIHVLQRGEINHPLDLAEPGALSLIETAAYQLDPAQAQDDGQRRAALARWLSAPENALTWRSLANRLWQYHFGRGLVTTPNDFGRLGAAPTHPELLDWLACELRDHGGSLKRLHRLIVTSAVYRQASDYGSSYAEQDADNRFLWRMDRRRLDAEAVRDSLPRMSGKLDLKMGGPSVKQFLEKPGAHVTPEADYSGFDPDHPSNYRRSVYRFVLRTVPDPFMQTLDCPDASQLVPQRGSSNTPLQSLALLNDGFVVRQSQHLASRAKRAGLELDTQVARVFQEILGRRPSPREARAVADYAARHGLANACRVLFNSNEFLFVD